MKKLVYGIVEFRRNVRAGYREKFGRLVNGQAPDALFVACSDSRVVPNTFASTDPGDLFVIRNVGNLIPPCGDHGISASDESEAAAIEFSILNLNISDIIICGHSECGAMQALLADRSQIEAIHLKEWLRHGEKALDRLTTGFSLDSNLSRHNQLSQINVLTQMENIKTYPIVKERIEAGQLHVHGWWFDIAHADVYSFSEEQKKFVLLDEVEANRVLSQIKK